MKTAVDYIKEKLMCNEYWYENMTFDQIFNQAKEMEKEQMINFAENYETKVYEGMLKSAEQYYNKTFKQQEQCLNN